MGEDEWGRLWPMKKILDGGTWGRLCVRGVGVFLAVRLLCLLRRIFGGGAGLGGGIDLLALFGKKVDPPPTEVTCIGTGSGGGLLLAVFRGDIFSAGADGVFRHSLAAIAASLWRGSFSVGG